MHQIWQKIGTSVVTQIIAWFKITSFVLQELAKKHIPSKTSCSTSFFPWITPEIRRKIRRRNMTHDLKAKKTGSSKLRSKFVSLRRLM